LAFIFIDKIFKFDLVDSAFCSIVVPFQKYISLSTNFITNNLSVISNVFEIENENIKLKNKIEKFKLKSEYYKSLERENKKLNNLLEIKSRLQNFEMTGARVIAKDENMWFDIFIIDKGLIDGLKKNMVVVTNGAILGKITDVKKNFSKVKSLIDINSSMSIKNTRNGDLGFVKGDAILKKKGLCKLDFFDELADIKIGDEIVTSQLSNIFFANMIVGKIIKNNKNNIILKPACDLKNIEYVLIIESVLDLDSDQNFEEKNFDLKSGES
jgi:rod shape-determining protein MreC